MNRLSITLGIAGGAAAMALLSPVTSDALEKLQAGRIVHARLGVEAARPDVPVALVTPGLATKARDEAEARAAILAQVNMLARTGGVLVETVAAAPMPQGLAAVRLRVSGAEKAVFAFADALERQRPMMRLRSWRVEPVPGGIRLSGEVLAPWQ